VILAGLADGMRQSRAERATGNDSVTFEDGDELAGGLGGEFLDEAGGPEDFDVG